MSSESGRRERQARLVQSAEFSSEPATWVTKWVTELNRKVYLFRINSLEGEFESSPGHHFPLFFIHLESFSKVVSKGKKVHDSSDFESHPRMLADRWSARELNFNAGLRNPRRLSHARESARANASTFSRYFSRVMRYLVRKTIEITPAIHISKM